MKKLSKIRFLAILWMTSLNVLSAQVLETKNWCLSRCDIAGDERKNTELMHLRLRNDSIRNLTGTEKILRFPLRIGIIQTNTQILDIDETKVRNVIDQLNQSFFEAGIQFYLEKVVVIVSPLQLEDLSGDSYGVYNAFSELYDVEDMISLYVFKHGQEFCTVEGTSISCSRTGGFSYVLSERTNNIVISRFDLSDVKVVAHEFGHFFGLYHTFEVAQFGRDDFNAGHCSELGDRVCDTPPDPGDFFEIYVNYADCEMYGHRDGRGHEYKPLISNFMSYYKPCYMKRYDFTPGQISLLRVAGQAEIRKRFSR